MNHKNMIMLSKVNQTQNDNITQFYLHAVSITSKFTETESRIEVIKVHEERVMAWYCVIFFQYLFLVIKQFSM